MRKICAFLLTGVILLSLGGCRKSDKNNGSDQYITSEIVYYEDVEGEAGTSGGSGSNKPESNESVPAGGVFTAHKNKLAVEGAGTDKNAKYDTKGTVTVSVSSYRPADYEAMFDAFSSVYPNIEIVLDYRPRYGTDAEECNHYLSTRAMAGNMPDVVFDDAGMLPVYLTQGWLYPLDSFVKGDSVFSNVPATLVRDYTYGGKLYALPHQAHFSGVILNVDAFDDLNMNLPSLSWNMDEFENVLKTGTTDKYSGCELLNTIEAYTAGCYSPDATVYGYDISKRCFNMGNSFAPALKFERKLRSYPGLEAYQLRFTNSSSGVSDYVSKFGNGNTSVVDMAFKLGRTLVHMDQGTWADDYINSIANFNWKLHPYPQSTAGRIPIHVDHCFMTTSTKNAEAAFQVLRYMTYSTEGNLARLSMYDAANKGKYALNSRIYYPTVSTKEVAQKFESLPGITDIDKFFYQNIGNGYRVDLIKLVPGWTDITTALSTAMEGKDNVDVDSLIPSLESKANSIANKNWSEFDTKLKKVQASLGK